MNSMNWAIYVYDLVIYYRVEDTMRKENAVECAL